MTPEMVLAYWFGDNEDAAAVMAEKGPIWFRGGAAVDAEIAAQFGDAVAAGARGDLDAWTATPRGALALIILLDQFTRNIHRGTGRMYDADPKARAVADALVSAGLEQTLPPIMRVFAYLPFEHHEDLPNQHRAVALFEALAEAEPALAGYVGYAEQHRDIVAKYGRFPHRNALLGRESSAEERAYVEAGGGF